MSRRDDMIHDEYLRRRGMYSEAERYNNPFAEERVATTFSSTSSTDTNMWHIREPEKELRGDEIRAKIEALKLKRDLEKKAAEELEAKRHETVMFDPEDLFL